MSFAQSSPFPQNPNSTFTVCHAQIHFLMGKMCVCGMLILCVTLLQQHLQLMGINYTPAMRMQVEGSLKLIASSKQ